MDLEITGGESSLGSGGESSAGSRPNRYELQKLRDWNTFLQYLKNQRPPLSLPSCSGAHVIEFLKLVGQVGQTIIHLTTCAFYGNPIPPAACECPLKLSWGSLDSLIGRLRAAYEESGGPSDSNPFAAKDVQSYLRGVREEQAKARGITYGKKRKQRPSNSAAAASQPEGGATDSSETSTPTTAAPSTSIYGYANLGGRLLLPKTQNPFMPNGKEQSVTYVPVWIRPPDLPVQWWTGSMLSNFASTVGAQEKVSEETGGKGTEEACKAPDPEVGSEEEAHPPPVRRNAKEKTTSTEIPKGILKKPGTDTSSNDVITPGEGEGNDPKKPPHASERIVELPPLESAPLVVVRLGASGIEGSRSFSWKDDKIASSILSKIQVHIGNTKLGYPIINKEKFNRELDSLEEKGDKWSDPWFLNLLDDTLMGLPRALRGSEVKVSRPCEPRKVRWLKSSGGVSSA